MVFHHNPPPQDPPFPHDPNPKDPSWAVPREPFPGSSLPPTGPLPRVCLVNHPQGLPFPPQDPPPPGSALPPHPLPRVCPVPNGLRQDPSCPTGPHPEDPPCPLSLCPRSRRFPSLLCAGDVQSSSGFLLSTCSPQLQQNRLVQSGPTFTLGASNSVQCRLSLCTGCVPVQRRQLLRHDWNVTHNARPTRTPRTEHVKALWGLSTNPR